MGNTTHRASDSMNDKKHLSRIILIYEDGTTKELTEAKIIARYGKNFMAIGICAFSISVLEIIAREINDCSKDKLRV